uniref:DNA-directed DNA polymerase n=1 Tax=Ditylenchus dipsaci TaxID=166011 RepID=A0A915DMY3_9BILA
MIFGCLHCVQAHITVISVVQIVLGHSEPNCCFCRLGAIRHNKNFEAKAFAHNGGKFDMLFVYREIFNLGSVLPEIFRQGTKLYEMCVAKRGMLVKTTFHVSYNLVPILLALFKKSFELHVEEKAFFPYLYNNPANYGQVLSHLPPRDNYLHCSMKPTIKEKFEQWYSMNYNTPLTFVNSCLAIIAKFDILQTTMTIASACMKHFRINYLRTDTIGIVPEKGYTEKSAEGEQQMSPHKLDVYVQRHAPVERPLGIEISGCVWHGHKLCFPDDQMLIPVEGVESRRSMQAELASGTQKLVTLAIVSVEKNVLVK